MYLKKVSLYGFKSFARRTELVFEPSGITAIVGPNGCGKSNIVDAIKWVLGERKSKRLRIGSTDEIIFEGSSSHKRMGMAEVSIHIVDEKDELKLGIKDIVITRRAFRTGESVYYINESEVRKKDIDNLFMDTGIGKNIYFIMEQGRIDQIISMKAQDRRALFEEAAGISKLLYEKIESEKRLKETEEKLKQLNGILNEIKKEKDLKEKQAKKTKRYLSLKQQQQELKAKILYIELKKLQEEEKAIKEKLEKYKDKNIALKKQKNRLEKAINKILSIRKTITHRYDELQKKRYEILNTLNQINSDFKVYKERLDEKEKQLTKYKERLAEIKTEIKKLKKKKKEIKININEEQNKIEKYQQEIKEKRDELQKIKISIKKHKEIIRELKNENKRLVELRKKLIKEIGNLTQKLINFILDKQKELDQFKQNILTIFTHEFKTPINAILNYSDYIYRNLQKELTPKKIEKLVSYAKKIHINGLSNLDMVENILYAIKSLTADNNAYTQTLNLKHLILSSIAKYQNSYDKELVLDLDDIEVDIALKGCLH